MTATTTKENALSLELLPSSENLQQFCHSRQGQKLQTVIGQVDVLAQLLLKMYEADFVGVFYRNEQHDVLLPVAYESWEGSEIQGLDRLEQQWLVRAEELATLATEEIRLDEKGCDEQGRTDKFALANKFCRQVRYPIYAEGRLKGIVLVYWRNRAGVASAQPAYIMKSLMSVMLGSISVLEQVQEMDSFLMRLSSLIHLFETPLEEARLEETYNRIYHVAAQLLPSYQVFRVTPDKTTGAYGVFGEDDSGSIAPLHDNVAEAVRKAAEELLGRLDRKEVPARNWHHLKINTAHNFSDLLLMDIHVRDRIRAAIILCCNAVSGATTVDLELASVLRLFGNILLSNATLVRDLTKSNVLIRESTDRVADLESMAALADMTSGIAHRLNNVVGGVSGRLQLMQVRSKDEAAKQELQAVEEMVMEGARAVKRIQEFASCSRSSFMEKVSLTALLRQYQNHATHDWDSLAARKSVNVTFDIVDEPVRLEGNSVDLLTMVNRLVENAVEHAPEGSEVTVVCDFDDEHYGVHVSDTGPGISDTIRKKIFLPFFSTKPDRDAGMGLAVVHSIVVRHGGAITLDTDPGAGTTFHVRFDRPSKLEDTSKIVTRAQEERQYRILAVDDDPQILDVLKDMLVLDGHEVFTAPDGAGAVEMLNQHVFDIMITDLGMPGMSGLDLSGIAHDLQPEMAIAMVTGWGTQLNSDEMELRGIRNVLAKPFHLRDIRALVTDLRLSRRSDPDC